MSRSRTPTDTTESLIDRNDETLSLSLSFILFLIDHRGRDTVCRLVPTFSSSCSSPSPKLLSATDTHPPLVTLELLDSYLSRLPRSIIPPPHWYSRKIVVSRHFAKKFEVNKKSRMAFAVLRRPAPALFHEASLRQPSGSFTPAGVQGWILGICCYFSISKGDRFSLTRGSQVCGRRISGTATRLTS